MRARFWVQFQVWAVLASLVALPSAFFALTLGFFSLRATCLGLLTGVTTYIALFAFLTSSISLRRFLRRGNVIGSLRRAASLKALWGGLGLLCYLVGIAGGLGDAWLLVPLTWSVLADIFVGAASLSVMEPLRIWLGVSALELKSSFLGALLVTLLQGAGITFELLLLAMAIGAWKARAR